MILLKLQKWQRFSTRGNRESIFFKVLGVIDYDTGVQDRAIFLIFSLSISTGNPARIK
ncbi:MAG: hypothetical protein WCL42_09220 [Chlorobiaceae bacterium]